MRRAPAAAGLERRGPDVVGRGRSGLTWFRAVGDEEQRVTVRREVRVGIAPRRCEPGSDGSPPLAGGVLPGLVDVVRAEIIVGPAEQRVALVRREGHEEVPLAGGEEAGAVELGSGGDGGGEQEGGGQRAKRHGFQTYSGREWCQQCEGAERRREYPAAPRPFQVTVLQRPKFIAPTRPNDVFEPSSPIGMLMLGFTLNRELNTNPVPSVSSA